MVTPRMLACVGLLAFAPMIQSQTAPTAYTITQNVNAPGVTSTVYRSGSKALAIVNQPAQGGAPASRTYSLYDLATDTDYAWNPDASPVLCGAGTFSGDWGDPFGMTADVTKGIASGDLKPAGGETVDGISAQIYTGSSPQASEKVWLDQKDGLVLRATMAAPGAAPMTLIDITQVSFAQPDPSLFVLPAACAGQKPPPTAAQLIADETGDDAGNYVSASYGPGSQTSCNAVLRVVQARTMTPISNIQVAIDTDYDQNNPNPPHYEFGVADNGTETFAGGHLRQITAGIHDGEVNLGAVPAYFNLVVNVVEPGHSGGTGLAYRQCFAPTTVLLYVVKDYGQSGESADLLWAKSGKYAAPPAN